MILSNVLVVCMTKIVKSCIRRILFKRFSSIFHLIILSTKKGSFSVIGMVSLKDRLLWFWAIYLYSH